ncbi:copper-binding protein [Xanthobacter sp. KR7-65]|uniref:copper-binding protein n=1 Tax=Xanthobacter sp. KR7-65 TaxID=3156612 RepID=UPI0032B62813
MRRTSLAIAALLWAGAAAAQAVPASGEVTRIDTAQNKITLRHGPIKNLDMEPMTMIFTVADPAVLKTLKVGQKVTFEADRVDGRLTVTKIQAAKK